MNTELAVGIVPGSKAHFLCVNLEPPWNWNEKGQRRIKLQAGIQVVSFRNSLR